MVCCLPIDKLDLDSLKWSLGVFLRVDIVAIRPSAPYLHGRVVHSDGRPEWQLDVGGYFSLCRRPVGGRVVSDFRDQFPVMKEARGGSDPYRDLTRMFRNYCEHGAAMRCSVVLKMIAYQSR